MKKIILIFLNIFITALILGQNRKTEIDILTKKADSLYDANNLDNALVYFRKLDSLSVTYKDYSSRIYALKAIRAIFSWKGKYDESIRNSEILLKIANQLNDKPTQLYALRSIAWSYFHKRDFEASIKFLEKIIKVSENFENEDTISAQRLYVRICKENGDFELAKVKSFEALDAAKNLCLFSVQSSIYSDLGYIEFVNSNFNKALDYFKKAIVINEKKSSVLNFVPHANAAECFVELKQFDSAAYYLDISYNIALKADNPNDIASVALSMGEMFYKTKEYDKSILYLMKSDKISDSIQNVDTGLMSSQALASLYADINDYENAYLYVIKQLSWKDSISKKTTERKLEEFQTKYETKEKENQIVTLNEENKLKATIIEQKQKQKQLLWIIFAISILALGFGMWYWQRIHKKRLLANQNNLRFKSILEAEQKERKRIAQDLHDSLGQSIAVLRMQASALSVLNEDKTLHQKLLKQVDATYDELRNISHNIIPNTLIRLGLIPAVRELITEVESAETLKINLEEPCASVELNENQTLTIYRIIQEAIVNVIKHAEATLLNIILKHKEGIISLYIKDNGKGMNTALLENNPGLGWKNIYSRVELLSGNITVDSKPNQGTIIVIHLRDSHKLQKIKPAL